MKDRVQGFLVAPRCPGCGKPTLLKEGASRYRRGSRVVPVRSRFWECPRGCSGPDGERPFRFHDVQLMRSNDQAARRAWKERFGEEMPRAAKPGRKPAERRSERVQVLLTKSDLRRLDASRGAVSRSEYLRSRALPAAPSGPARRTAT